MESEKEKTTILALPYGSDKHLFVPVPGRIVPEDEAEQSIILRMVEADGYGFDFLIGLDDDFAGLRKLHSERRGICADKIAFFYNGNRIGDNDTPRLLKMEEDDVVVVQSVNHNRQQKQRKESSNKKQNLIKPEEMEGYIGDKTVEEICALLDADVKTKPEEKSQKKQQQQHPKLKEQSKKNKRKNRQPNPTEHDPSPLLNLEHNFQHDTSDLHSLSGKPSKREQSELPQQMNQSKESNNRLVDNRIQCNSTPANDVLEAHSDKHNVSEVVPMAKKCSRTVAENKPMADVKYSQFEIEERSKGHDYVSIFSMCFDDAVKEVYVVDPWIISHHQITNFKVFCDIVVQNCSNLVKIYLVTRPQAVKGALDNLKQLLKHQHKVELEIEIRSMQHDRQIRFDNGWTVKIGRGLDIYHKPESNSTSTYDYHIRECKKTTVDIIFKETV